MNAIQTCRGIIGLRSGRSFSDRGTHPTAILRSSSSPRYLSECSTDRPANNRVLVDRTRFSSFCVHRIAARSFESPLGTGNVFIQQVIYRYCNVVLSGPRRFGISSRKNQNVRCVRNNENVRKTCFKKEKKKFRTSNLLFYFTTSFGLSVVANDVLLIIQ